MKKITPLIILSCSITLASCGGASNSDGSSKLTYSSCSITKSTALLASNRASDISQCWDGVDYKEQSLALDWCSKKVNNYLASRYSVVLHSVEYQVASTNCPQ